MSERLFGTDGIRARAGEFPLTDAAVSAIGQAIGERLSGRILIGQDTRVSSPWIFEHLKAGIARTTSQIEDAGVIPTPAIALLSFAITSVFEPVYLKTWKTTFASDIRSICLLSTAITRSKILSAKRQVNCR